MGELANSRIYNFLGWGTFTMISAAVIVMLGGKLLDLFGIQLFNN